MTAIGTNSATAAIYIGQQGDVTNTANSASGGSGGSGSGGQSAEASEKEQFYQIYNAINQVLGIKGSARVMSMAFKNRQPGSGYLTLVKKFDPAYLKTDDFRNQAAKYVAKWKEYLPGAKIDYMDMKKWVRGDYSNERIEQVIMKTKAFKRAYPFFKYGEDNVQQYRAIQQHADALMENAFGMKTNRREQEMIFDYDLDPGDLDQRVEEFVTGISAVDMMMGADQKSGRARLDDYIFATPGNLARRALLKQAVQTQQGLNESDLAQTQRQRESRGRITQTGI